MSWVSQLDVVNGFDGDFRLVLVLGQRRKCLHFRKCKSRGEVERLPRRGYWFRAPTRATLKLAKFVMRCRLGACERNERLDCRASRLLVIMGGRGFDALNIEAAAQGGRFD